MKKNIALIGYMGAGKSTVGKLLSRMIDVDFQDLDSKIVQESGVEITDVFARYGEYYFRKFERQHLKKCIAAPKLILAMGGGTPCYFNNMEIIKNHFLSIYLSYTPEVLSRRLKDEKQNRPMLNKITNLEEYINEHLNARQKYYKQADIVLELNTETPEEICQSIIQRLDSKK